MMKKIVVAVDGPAGSGKSSVSRQAAVGLGLKYVDSGALYRSITWYVLGRDGAVAPGERIGLAVVGIGGRGSYDLSVILQEPDVQCVAVCDVAGALDQRLYL